MKNQICTVYFSDPDHKHLRIQGGEVSNKGETIEVKSEGGKSIFVISQLRAIIPEACAVSPDKPKVG